MKWRAARITKIQSIVRHVCVMVVCDVVTGQYGSILNDTLSPGHNNLVVYNFTQVPQEDLYSACLADATTGNIHYCATARPLMYWGVCVEWCIWCVVYIHTHATQPIGSSRARTRRRTTRTFVAITYVE